MFPTMPAYFEIRGFPNDDITTPSEVFRTEKTLEEAESARDEAENVGWVMVRIIERGPVHK